MELHWIGLVAAASTFLGIWLGHVVVRVIEARLEHLWIPMSIALALGLGFEYWSLSANGTLISAATGILGVTFLWDSFEFWRQQNRIIKGHAPANPDNPRHARILAESEHATPLDLLARDPIGRPVDPQEAVRLVKENRL